MSELFCLYDLLKDIGVDFNYDAEDNGWGHPDYILGHVRIDGLNFPPKVKTIELGCSVLYFDLKTERFLGWYNREYSRWYPREER